MPCKRPEIIRLVTIIGALLFLYPSDSFSTAAVKTRCTAFLLRFTSFTYVSPEEAAEKLGMSLEHVKKLSAYSKKTRNYFLMRPSNAAGHPYHNDPHAVAKPVDVKLKTAKFGPHAGLVIRPRRVSDFGNEESFRVARELWKKHWPKLKKKGFKLRRGGVVLTSEGNIIYSDYDLEGVYDTKGNLVPYGNGLNDDPDANEAADRLVQLNVEVSGLAVMFQHGSKDSYVIRKNADNLFLRHHGFRPKSPIGVFEPNGGIVLLDSEGSLRTYYEQRHFKTAPLFWPD